MRHKSYTKLYRRIVVYYATNIGDINTIRIFNIFDIFVSNIKVNDGRYHIQYHCDCDVILLFNKSTNTEYIGASIYDMLINSNTNRIDSNICKIIKLFIKKNYKINLDN